MDGKVDQVISGIDHKRQHATGSQVVKALDDLTGYLSLHKHMMDYPAYQAAGYPLASAAIESYQQAPRRPALQARRHDLERGRP